MSMDPPEFDERLLDVAFRITDGVPIDWPTEATRHPEIDTLLEEFELLARLGREHHGPETVEAEPLFAWGHLRIRRLVGRGSFGEVYAAWDPTLRREVALKLRPPGSAGAAGRGTTGWLEEARQLARLRHPHILSVHGADIFDGRPGIWSDLIVGRTLEALLRDEGPRSAREAALIGIDLCAALATVHGAGLVHGDIKAANVMRVGRPDRAMDSGRIVLMDFGSARRSDPGQMADGQATPIYSAPEILAGGSPSAASDIYALGVLLFRLVTGSYPIEARTLAELRTRLAAEERTSLLGVRPDLPSGFIQTVESMLLSDPALRSGSAGSVQRALLGALGAGASTVPAPFEGLRIRWRTLRAIGLAAVVSLFAVAAGRLWPRIKQLNPPAPSHPMAIRLRTVVDSPDALAYFGAPLLFADLDGDHRDELVVASLLFDRDRGRVQIFDSAGLMALNPRTVLLGEAPGDRFGSSLATGDLNGDGRLDLIVGAYAADGRAKRSGATYIYFGGADWSAGPSLKIDGWLENQDFGFSLASVLDPASGRTDLLVGAPTEMIGGLPTGAAHLYRGGADLDAVPDLDFSRPSPDAQFGVSEAAPGDLTADGQPELVIGANWERFEHGRLGAVYVYEAGSRLDASPDFVLQGLHDESWFGQLTGPGDLNGDGFADLAVTAEFDERDHHTDGAIYVYFGGPHFDEQPDRILPGDSNTRPLGTNVIGRDFNQDGTVDLIVGGMHAGARGTESGAAAFFAGGASAPPGPDFFLLGHSGDRFGRAVEMSDSFWPRHTCVVVGAQRRSALKSGGGACYLFDLNRYLVVSPEDSARVSVTKPLDLRWLGAAPVDIAVSADGGRRWERQFAKVGGAAENRASLSLTGQPGTSLEIRLTPSDTTMAGQEVIHVELVAGT